MVCSVVHTFDSGGRGRLGFCIWGQCDLHSVRTARKYSETLEKEDGKRGEKEKGGEKYYC